jgi:hypothetical protein
MMDNTGIIKTENTNEDLARYEEVLMRRDSLRKKAEQYQISYFKEFGDLIVEAFTVRIECIKKKKIIAYCQLRMNKGETINGALLDTYIGREMADYKSDLEHMIEHNKAVKNSGRVSEYDMYRIKQYYHSLAKLIHPDLHPEYAGDEVLMDLWYEVVIAYEHNRLEEIQELDFKVRKYLEDRGAGSGIAVTDLPAKIARVEEEIERITTTEPYLYKLLLDDEEAVNARRKELREEIESYTEYSRQLDEVISQFNIERNYS